MREKLLDLGNGFYNIRGNFRVGGVINIGTHCSLIELDAKRFIFLDSYTLTGDIRKQVMALTDNGHHVEAVLNVHPFHTVHCQQMAKDFPNAKFYGSLRHQQKIPNIAWQNDLVESPAVAQRYPELQFSVPDGIYYIHPNEKIHVGSLLVFHDASGCLHVDDTFSTMLHFNTIENFVEKIDYHLPKLILKPLFKLAFKAEIDAKQQFYQWLEKIAESWRNTRYVCAAHSETVAFEEGEFASALKAALHNIS